MNQLVPTWLWFVEAGFFFGQESSPAKLLAASPSMEGIALAKGVFTACQVCTDLDTMADNLGSTYLALEVPR